MTRPMRAFASSFASPRYASKTGSSAVSGVPARAFLAAIVVTSANALFGCSDAKGDRSAAPTSNILGDGLRIRDVTNPNNPNRPGVGANVNCSGVTIVHVDTFDETSDGKSTGTIFLQDVGSSEPYSGVGTYGATFIPASLRVAPGDVLDFRGVYQENANIGTAKFADGQPLPQLFRPTGTFRFEGAPPVPTVIDVSELASYNTGRKWLGMLVTIKNVTVTAPTTDDKGRVTGKLLSSVLASTPTVTNELYDLKEADIATGTSFQSITGVVTYFFNFHVAPRSAADLVK